MNNGVLVVSNTRQPMMPTSSARARKLLTKGNAAVLRRYPFTIILKNREKGETQPLRVKIDPGSRETGIVLINEVTRKVVFALVLTHRGRVISKNLESRRSIRRNRRNRKTRYRKPGVANRRKPEGWLAPSLLHRVLTTMTWVKRLSRFAPVSAVSQELVRFDFQQMVNPEISGIEYQRGTLFEYEIKEYLLEKYHRRCVYCGAHDVPLEKEHIVPRANGGTNMVSNLVISCRPCNEKKGKLDIRTFLKEKPELLDKILKQVKTSLRDAGAVNSTRWNLLNKLKATDLPVEIGSGGRTKFNRSNQGYQKEHWIDAACVGISGSNVFVPTRMKPLIAKAAGHGNRQMCKTDKYGFPNSHRTRQKIKFGYQTGDIVMANVPKGKRAGIHVGRVLVRTSGKFDIQTHIGRAAGISFKHLKIIQKMDGYCYA